MDEEPQKEMAKKPKRGNLYFDGTMVYRQGSEGAKLAQKRREENKKQKAKNVY